MQEFMAIKTLHGTMECYKVLIYALKSWKLGFAGILLVTFFL